MTLDYEWYCNFRDTRPEEFEMWYKECMFRTNIINRAFSIFWKTKKYEVIEIAERLLRYFDDKTD